MNIFNWFTGKKKDSFVEDFAKSLRYEKKNIFFEITDGVITNPDGWGPEIVALVNQLTDSEKSFLQRVFGLLQEHCEHHYEFWNKHHFTSEMMRSDINLLFRSYFELLMVDWTIATHELRRREVKREVGQVLWYVIHFSLDSYSSALYSQATFTNYKSAFQSREQLYPKIFNFYFSDNDGKKNIAIQNLYTLMIASPLTNDTSSLENESFGHSILDGTIDFGNWQENAGRVITFHNSFAKGLGAFANKIKVIVLLI